MCAEGEDRPSQTYLARERGERGRRGRGGRERGKRGIACMREKPSVFPRYPKTGGRKVERRGRERKEGGRRGEVGRGRDERGKEKKEEEG